MNNRNIVKVLIAEDDAVTSRLLKGMLQDWGYEPVIAFDGNEAWEVLQAEDAPPLAILDWMMPGMDGIEICRRIRENPAPASTFIILLTGKVNKEDIIFGLEAGANDCITKPFNPEELRVRVQAGRRIIDLQSELSARVRELERVMEHIKILQGILPICSYCKKVRNDQNYWQRLESYLVAHSDVQFSHGVCPECYQKHVITQILSLPNRL